MQRIIELAPQTNGAHRNQTYHGVLPEGWAVIPEGMETENFPFGVVTAEGWAVIPEGMETENFPFGVVTAEALPCPGDEAAVESAPVMTVTGWTPLPMPEPEPEAEAAPSVWDELDAAYREGVNDV